MFFINSDVFILTLFLKALADSSSVHSSQLFVKPSVRGLHGIGISNVDRGKSAWI